MTKNKKKLAATPWGELTDIVSNIVGVPEAGLTPETTFDDLGADSLDIAEILVDVEQSFATLIEDEQVAEWKTLGDAMRWLEANADLKGIFPYAKAKAQG